MWKKIKTTARQLPMRWKMTVIVIVLFVSMVFCILGIVTRYSTGHYTKLQQQYNEAIMQEMSAELDTVSSNIDTLYRTFNSQRLFTEETVNGASVFQSIHNQIQFERLVSEVINANNLQDLIIGTLFYLTEDSYYYVGRGSVAGNWTAEESDWYRQFVESGGRRMFYGPIVEDFKSEATTRYESLYYIAPYGNVAAQKGTSFLLFTLHMDGLIELVERNSVRQSPLMIINDSGTVLHTAEMSDEDAEKMLPLFIEKAKGNSKSLSYFDGNKYICAYYQDSFDWWIVFVDESDSFFSDLSKIYRNLILMLIVFAAIGGLVASITIKHVMMPLTTLDEFIDIMQTDPDAFIVADAQTETGRIGVRLNEMKRKLQSMDKEMFQLQYQEKEAQVSAMQAQINPHFIYNTLDNIYCMAHLEETQPIISLSDHLSQMMRYSLSMKQKIVPLSYELEHIKSYITILNIRFEDKIELVDEIDEELLSYPVLKLSLQPLAENAWKHGLSFGDGGVITISASIMGDRLELYMDNTGPEVPESLCQEINKKLEAVHYGEANYRESHGISMENINNRLKLTYGLEYGLKMQPREGGGCRLIIQMPFSNEEKDIFSETW